MTYNKGSYATSFLIALSFLSCEVTRMHAQTPAQTDTTASPPHGVDFGTYAVFSSNNLGIVVGRGSTWGTVEVTQRETVPSYGGQGIVEAAPGTTPGTYWREDTFPFPYEFKLLAARHGQEYYLSGHRSATQDGSSWDDSTTVIEHWTLSVPEGSPYVERTTSTTPLGQAEGLSELRIGVQGSVYKVPDLRDAPILNRTLVAEVPFAVNAMEVDPQGRYLMLVSSSMGAVYRLDLLNPTSEPTPLITSLNYPAIGNAEYVIKGRLQDGVKRFLIGCEGGTAILLGDPDNDGTFEQIEQLNQDAYYAKGLDDLEAWLETYDSYSIPGLDF